MGEVIKLEPVVPADPKGEAFGKELAALLKKHRMAKFACSFSSDTSKGTTVHVVNYLAPAPWALAAGKQLLEKIERMIQNGRLV